MKTYILTYTRICMNAYTYKNEYIQMKTYIHIYTHNDAYIHTLMNIHTERVRRGLWCKAQDNKWFPLIRCEHLGWKKQNSKKSSFWQQKWPLFHVIVHRPMVLGCPKWTAVPALHWTLFTHTFIYIHCLTHLISPLPLPSLHKSRIGSVPTGRVNNGTASNRSVWYAITVLIEVEYIGAFSGTYYLDPIWNHNQYNYIGWLRILGGMP